MKELEFAGDSRSRLGDFPKPARQRAGRQLGRVQRGQEPDDWKSVPLIGAGVRELRIWDEAGTFRVIYLAKLVDRVVVLHAFKKKTQATSRKDIDLAKRRYRTVVA